MNVFIKQISGRTIALDVNPNINIVDLAVMAYEKRAESQKDALMPDYAKSINLMYSFRKLAYDKKLSDYGLVEDSTITEVGKPFTMTPDFNWGTLSIIDAISLEVTEEPYMLNPGCDHAFEKLQLKSWIQTELAAHKTPDCPTCRSEIPLSHVVNLMLFAPSPALIRRAPSSDASAAASSALSQP